MHFIDKTKKEITWFIAIFTSKNINREENKKKGNFKLTLPITIIAFYGVGTIPGHENWPT